MLAVDIFAKLTSLECARGGISDAAKATLRSLVFQTSNAIPVMLPDSVIPLESRDLLCL